MPSEAQKRATAKYRKANSRQLTVTLSKKYDKDIIDFLDLVPNKSEFLKRIIREKIPKVSDTVQ